MGVITDSFAAGDQLHLWMRPHGDAAVARVAVAVSGTIQELAVEGATRNPLPVAWDCPRSGEVRLEWDDATVEVTLAYAFSPTTVTETGIRILHVDPAARTDAARFRFHAKPPFGWMNDPNGLCEVDGLMHLFYQHNPHDRRWDTMHWGHSVSRKGIDWVPQPLALLPREALVRGPARQGGAFSGSALARPDGSLRLYFTERDDDRTRAREWQMSAVLAGDTIAGPPAVILDDRPPVPGFRDDWRDPFVFAGPDGRLKMLLGGADGTGSVVLLYETDDPEGAGGWRFADVLVRDPSPRPIPAECPSMIKLDGADLWLLIYGLLGSREAATRRRNLTRARVGRFDGRMFTPVYERELDFGTDCYAMQVWHGADGPRGIAWAANWTDVSTDRDFESAMTLPRRLLWQDGQLHTPPVAAVETLRIGASTAFGPGDRVPLDGGLAELAVDVPADGSFVLAFDHPTHEMALTYDGRVLEFHYDPPGLRAVPSYRTAHPGLRDIRIFVDVGLIEIYADGGRTCCTKRVDSSVPVEAVRLASGDLAFAGKMWPLRASRNQGGMPPVFKGARASTSP